jgi:hypothetical protein
LFDADCSLNLCERLAKRAHRYGYAMFVIADTPGNANDINVAQRKIVPRTCVGAAREGGADCGQHDREEAGAAGIKRPGER